MCVTSILLETKAFWTNFLDEKLDKLTVCKFWTLAVRKSLPNRNGTKKTSNVEHCGGFVDNIEPE